MKVIVHGVTGKMGKVLVDLLNSNNYEASFACGVSPDVDVNKEGYYKNFDDVKKKADVVIDFSYHGATKELLSYCVKNSLNVVIATTGHTEEEKALIYEASKHIGIFYSANMSIGVAVLCDLAKRAALAFDNANIEIVETHHNQKLDIPSGTALMLASSIKEVRENCTYNIGRPNSGKRSENEIGIHSLRMGNVTGIHEVIITTSSEAITLKHEAYSRSLFAEGAIKAASFLVNKKPGMYNMKDIVK